MACIEQAHTSLIGHPPVMPVHPRVPRLPHAIAFRALALAALVALAPGAHGQGGDYAAGAAAYTAGDYATAWRIWQALAASGNRDAQFGLGMLCTARPDVCDGTRAIDWYARAATAGHRLAQFNLGMAYRNGTGVATDEAKSRHWLERAAAQGLPAARLALADAPAHAGTLSAPTGGSHARAVMADATPDLHQPPDDALPWLTIQDPQFMTVQLAAGPVVDDLRALRRQHALDSSAHVLCVPATCYLVLGSFATPGEARSAIAALAPALRQRGPWPRALGYYQALLSQHVSSRD